MRGSGLTRPSSGQHRFKLLFYVCNLCKQTSNPIAICLQRSRKGIKLVSVSTAPREPPNSRKLRQNERLSGDSLVQFGVDLVRRSEKGSEAARRSCDPKNDRKERNYDGYQPNPEPPQKHTADDLSEGNKTMVRRRRCQGKGAVIYNSSPPGGVVRGVLAADLCTSRRGAEVRRWLGGPSRAPPNLRTSAPPRRRGRSA